VTSALLNLVPYYNDPELHIHCTQALSTNIESAAMFLWLGVLSTQILHKNGVHPTRENLKIPALHLRVEGKHFENGAFKKR